MKQFSDDECETIMEVSNALDRAIDRLDELPTLPNSIFFPILDQLSGIVAKLDAILKDEEF